MRRFSAAVLFFFALACLPVWPQDARPAFEAASLKRNDSGSGDVGSHNTTGQVTLDNMPLDRLLAQAYGLTPPQIVGPSWIPEAHFDIAAKYPPNTTSADRTAMLRTLLEDRFKLTVHRETRELSGFALVVAKGGFKLKPSDSPDHTSDHGGGRVQTLSTKKTSMEFLSGLLTRYTGQAVVDKTNIEGVYDFDLRWTSEDQSAADPARARDMAADRIPTLSDALQEVLGLRLQPQKVAAQVVVVDHIERVPVEN